LRDRNRRPWLVPLVALLVSAGAALVAAQEHPEHPSDRPQPKSAPVSKESLANAIRQYVKKDADLKGGFFLVYDRQAKKPLALTLEKVHEDKLARVADTTYFACADFKSEGGATFDLDIFMTGASEADLAVGEITIHKENGKERYTWAEEDGLWKRREKK
jgi:hypothetical protein